MKGILCPVCNTPTSFNAVLISDDHAYMPERSSERERVYDKAVVSAIIDADHPHKINYGIFECQACGERFVAKYHKYEDANWVAVYPTPHKPVSEEIPQPIRNQFGEAQICFTVQAYLGCLLICKTVLIAVQRDTSKSSLKQLQEEGLISGTLYKKADEVRLWANILGHEDVPDEITGDDCEQLLAYIDALLHAIYVEPKRLNALSQKRKNLGGKSDSTT